MCWISGQLCTVECPDCQRRTITSNERDDAIVAKALPWQAEYQGTQLCLADRELVCASWHRPHEASLVQSASAQPDPDPVEHEPAEAFASQQRLTDDHIDTAFRAAAEATQEAVLNALCMAPATPARSGRIYPSLADWLKENPLP